MDVISTQIERYCGTVKIKDRGIKGYKIEFRDLIYYNELSGYSFIKFESFDDYFKFYNIDNHLYFLYTERYHSNSCMVREDEKLFYNILKEIEKNIEDCKNMKIEGNDCTAIYELFVHIGRFIEELENGFKHKNKKIEKKFNKVAKDLKNICKY